MAALATGYLFAHRIRTNELPERMSYRGIYHAPRLVRWQRTRRVAYSTPRLAPEGDEKGTGRDFLGR